jgi:AI-2 transport protein TqsA
LIVWATILGASGAFLAIPMSLLVKAVLIDSDPDHRWLGALLSSDKPGKEPEETQGKDSDTVKPATGPPTAEAGAPGS